MKILGTIFVAIVAVLVFGSGLTTIHAATSQLYSVTSWIPADSADCTVHVRDGGGNYVAGYMSADYCIPKTIIATDLCSQVGYTTVVVQPTLATSWKQVLSNLQCSKPDLNCTYTGPISWAPACSATGTWNTTSGSNAVIGNTAAGYSGSITYSCSNGVYSYVGGSCSAIGTVSVSSNISSSWTITGPATITGSGTSQTSASQPIGTYTITWGAVAGYATPASQSFTLTSGGTISFSGTYSGNSCNLPWGGSITSGASATAYLSPSVVSPATCTSQSRLCTNGTLSGTYTNSGCTVTPASCTLPWGGSIASGASATAYLAPSVVSPATCTSQSRLCTNGTLSGTYTNSGCTVTPASCTLPWGGSITSGASATAYLAPSVVSPATCTSQSRTCTNGTLSGTYTNSGCTVTAAASATISASATTCTIASGASTCTIPFTWNITDAASPNLYNSTTANTYSTSASGTSLSYAITYGSNTVQARNSTTVLNSVAVTGSCVAGTAWSGSSCVSTNTSTAPTISINPTTYYAGVSNTYTFTATDIQGDQVRYGIDWNMDGSADDWLPAFPGYVNSGTSRSMSYTWPTTGNKQFQALTQDFQGLNSAWTVRNITVTDAPCANNTINPPTCTQCGDNIAYVNGFCVFCSTGGCTGTPGGNSTNGNSTLTCDSGAINTPSCNLCPGGQTLVGSMCVNNCANGATNPTACDACPAGQELIGGICTVTTSCGDSTCNGPETILTCPADCKVMYQQF